MSFDAIDFRVENRVAWVTLNRPEARNAINEVMREELISVFTNARTDTEIRALVVTGAGQGFCSGVELGKGSGMSVPGAAREMMKTRSQRLIRTLWDLEKPVIAAVNGVAAGIGAHLALACDLILAAETARFIEVFVRRGLMLDGAGAYLLARYLGLAKAKELVFFGDDLPAPDAANIGLINRVVPDAELLDTARRWAERLAQGPTFAIGMSKWLLNRASESSLEKFLEEEALAVSLVVQSKDVQEGIKAFMEKRKPDFRGE